MNRPYTACCSLLLGLALALGGIADAHAKRLGGGGSFGGKAAFNSPFKRGAQAPVRSPRQKPLHQDLTRDRAAVGAASAAIPPLFRAIT